MKKITLAIVAVIVGFVMSSCGSSTTPSETILKATDEFFTQAENNLQNIEDAEGFMAYFKNFENEKADFVQKLFANYMDNDGNITGFTEEEFTDLQNKLADRATAYNKVEGAKCAEFLSPIMDRYEQAVEAFWAKYQAQETIDEDTFNAMNEELNQAENQVFIFADYDNILPELQERYAAAAAKQAEMFEE